MNIDIVTIIIIGLNIAFSMKGFSDRSFFNRYKFQISPIKQGEKIRMLSSGFLHVNQQHLFFNMLTLYFFASAVISPGYYADPNGRFNFVLIYFGSLLAGSIFALFFHRKENFYTAVGASGAVSGILYAAILMNPNMMLGLFFIIPLPGYVFAIGYLLYSIYGMKNSIGNIGHSAHLGGAIGGYIITLLLKPEVFSTNKILVIALAVPILLLFFLKDKIKI
ncbi:MAG: rhomboid family intramembrane serine protease [Flavobacteriaceae bacterium]|nr:rhomboid family intramembrane serine protease [Flavobacteriaceae bacterium]